MQLYFIRHGLSENNLLWHRTRSGDGRRPDPELTPEGHQQARHLARFLLEEGSGPAWSIADFDPQNLYGFHPTHLYTSLMVRAVATASILAPALDLPLVAWTELHEVGGIHHSGPESGERLGLPGHDRAYFEERYPGLHLPASFPDRGWWQSRPYEVYEEAAVRARGVMQELLERHGESEDRVAVVSHGGFYRHLLRTILSMPAEAPGRFALNNCAVSRIDFVERGPQVQYLNRLDFMPRHLVT